VFGEALELEMLIWCEMKKLISRISQGTATTEVTAQTVDFG
jgi:hypothetical protein